jgi:hypothetical protein
VRFAEIENLLGPETLSNIEQNVTAAYEAAGDDQDGFRALREFLIGLLAAVVTTERHLPSAERFAAEDAMQLNALVKKIKSISRPAGGAVLEEPSDDDGSRWIVSDSGWKPRLVSATREG